MPGVFLIAPGPIFIDPNQQVVQSNDTLTASSSAVFTGFGTKEISLIVNVKAAPTGTAPTLTYTVQEVDPGDSTTIIGSPTSGTALTGVGTQTLTIPLSYSGSVRVSWAVGGTGSPTFTQVYATLVSKTSGGRVEVVGVTGGAPAPVTVASVGTNASAIPTSSTQVGGSDGTDLQAVRVFDADTGGGTQYVLGTVLRKSASGGSVEAGTSSDPLRVDPTGTTTQPVSGTVTANVGTTGGLALDATLTGGTARTKITDGTTNTAVKAASTAAVAADPALVVAISPNNSVAITAAALPLPSGAATETTLGTRLADATFTGRINTLGQKTSANSTPIVIASDQSRLPVSTEVQIDYDSGAGTQSLSVVGIGLPASGGAVAGGTSTNPIRTDPTGTTTQPVSGTVTAAQATAANLNATVTQGPGSGAAGTFWYVQVTDGTNTLPTMDTAARSGFQRITDGTNTAAVKAASTAPVAADPALVVAISPNSSITATNPSVGTNASAIPTSSTQVGGSDGTNLQAARVFDADAGGGTEYVLGAVLRKSASGGSVEAGTSADPLRTDPTGTTTQPVSGTVTANIGTSGSLALDATLTDGTQKAIVRGGAKGATVAADVTSTAEGADHQALDVQIYHGGTAINPTTIRALTSSDVVTAAQATAANLNATVTQGPGSGAAGTFWYVRVTDGTNTMPTADTAARSSFHRITDGTNTAAVKAASTSAVAADPALVVSVSPNNSVAITAASLPLPTGAATETTLGTRLADSTFTGRINTLGQKTSANSTPVVIASDQSAIPVSGTVTATNPSVGSNNAAIPTSSTQVGASDGTNLQVPRVFDADTGAGTQYVLGTVLRKSASGGSVEVGTSSDPLRVDPTGTTTQPVSGTVTANVGTTGGLALDATLTGGTQRTKVTDGTTNVAVMAASTAAVAADPALVVAISPNNSVAITAAALPLPSGAATETTLGTRLADATFTARINTLGQKTSANSTPVVIASDQSAIPVSGTVTATNPSVGTVGSAVPASATEIGASDGTNLQVPRVFDADSGAGTQYVLGAVLRKSASGGSVEAGTSADPLRTDPTGTTAQPVTDNGGSLTVDGTVTANQGTAAAATAPWAVRASDGSAFISVAIDRTTAGAPFSVRLTDGSAFYAAPTTGQFPSALVGGRLDTNIGTWLGSTAPTVGSKTSANSIPVVVASDQGAVPVSGTVTANIGTSGSLALDASITAQSVVDNAAFTDGTTRVQPVGFIFDEVAGTALTENDAAAARVDAKRAQVQVIEDGTTRGTRATVKAASTAAVAGDTALVVAVSPNNSVAITAASLPLPTGAATETTLASRLADATFTARINTLGQKTMANSTPVVIASDQSAIPVSGTVTATNPSVGTVGSAVPASATEIGASDGTNLQAVRVFDADTGAGTQYVLGTVLRKSASGGSVEAGTSSDPLRIDPTGTTTQPVSGTVTANIGTTNGLALDATLTGGTARTKITDGTTNAAVKAASTAAVAADPALVVVVSPNNSVAITAAALPLPSGAATETTLGTRLADATFTGRINTLGQKTSANSTPVVIASDQSAIPVSGTFTATNPSVGTNASAIPTSSTQVGGSDGTNLQAARVFDADSGAGTQYVLGAFLRKSASGGSVEAGTSSDPLRVDPTGTTTQPVSGTVTANIGTTNGLALDATLTGGTARTKITDGTTNTAVKAASTAAVAADPALVVAISPNNTVPISAASLPLPAGAATSANQTTLGNQTTKINDGANTAAVKAASTAAVAADPALVVVVSPNNSVAVTGTVTANIGTTNGLALDATLSAQSIVDNAAFTDGTTRVQPSGYVFDEVAGTALTENDAAAARIDAKRAQVLVIEDATTRGTRATVKAASTAAVAADPALVVTVSPNNSVAVTQATASNLNAQVQGTAADGATPVGNPVLTAGFDGTNVQTKLTDTSGRQRVVGAAADGAAVTGDPVLMGGQDGTNVQSILTDTTGRPVIVGAGTAGSPVGGIVSTQVPDTTASGTLNALNAAATITLAGQIGVGMQLAAGTLIGTIVPELSIDGGTTWFSTYFDDPATGSKSSSIVFSSSNTATARTIVGAGGASSARVRVSAFTSGTATCNVRASTINDPSVLFAAADGGVAPPVVAVIGGTDGTNVVAGRMKGASTVPVAADPALVVVLSPNQVAIPVTTSPSGSVPSLAFGDITLAAITTAAIRRTAYTEPSANFTGSVSSSSANDTSAGTGARTVRITWMNATGTTTGTENVTLNGTTPVNLVTTTKCFIEKIEVLTAGSGLVNAGTLSLFTGSAGGGTLVGTIAVGDNRTFWAHHYVVTGKTANVTGILFGTTVTNSAGVCNGFLRAITLPVSTSIEKQVSDGITIAGVSSSSVFRSYGSQIQVAGPARVTMYVTTLNGSSFVYRGSFDSYDL